MVEFRIRNYISICFFLCLLTNCLAQKKIVKKEIVGKDSTLILSKNEYGLMSVVIPNQNKNLFVGANAGGNTFFQPDSANLGNFNTFLGFNAGFNNGKGRGNTAVGFRAGGNLQNNNMNSYFGLGAGSKLHEGNENTFIGASAGAEAGYGKRNTFIGAGAGGNIGHGPEAKKKPISNNLFVGWQAGAKGGTLGDNIFIGNRAGAKNKNGQRNIFIGHGAGEKDPDLKNTLIIENSSANNPLIVGSFSKDFLKINGKLGFQVKHGNGLSSDGFSIQSVGGDTTTWRMHVDNSTGELKLFSSKFSTANGADKHVVSIDPMTGAFNSISDQFHKTNYELLVNSLQKIMSLSALKYNFVGQGSGAQKSIGFLAQRLKDVFPEAVKYSASTDVYHVNYDALSVISVQAIQEQNRIIDESQKKIEKLENRVETLEKLVQQLLDQKK